MMHSGKEIRIDFKFHVRVVKIICILLFVSIPLSACGSTDTPDQVTEPAPATPGPVTASPVPSIAGFTTYTDPNGGFNISYPSDWELGQTQNTRHLFTAGLKDEAGLSTVGITITVAYPAKPYDSIAQYAEETSFSVMKQSPKLFAVHEVDTKSILGCEVAQIEYDLLNAGVSQIHVLQSILAVNNQIWTVDCYARSEVFEVYREDLNNIIGSLQISGESPIEIENNTAVPAMPLSVAVPQPGPASKDNNITQNTDSNPSSVPPVQTETPTQIPPTKCEIDRDKIQVALDSYHDQNGVWPTADGLPGDIIWENLVPEFMSSMPLLDIQCEWQVDSHPEGRVCLLTPC